MKNYLSLLLAGSLLSLSCINNRHSELPFIDANKNYSEKEILLTDIADVSYVSLKADDNYLFKGGIQYVTENNIVILHYSSGEVLFFSRNGIPKSRFNNKGNGPGEYLSIRQVIYDESEDELFVFDHAKNIKVYSHTGKYKREIPIPEGSILGSDIVYLYGNSFLFLDEKMIHKRAEKLSDSDYINPYYRISKVDGKVLDYFEMSLKKIFLGMSMDGYNIPAMVRRLTRSPNGAFLCNPENDTVFFYNKNKSLTPVLHKKPEVGSMNPMVFINNLIEIEQYQFIELCTIRREDVYPGIFPANYYIRDKKSGEIFQQKFRLTDYKEKEFNVSPFASRSQFYGNGYWFELQLHELKEAYTNNKLTGKLKELVATLDEDDNNVIVFVDFK